MPRSQYEHDSLFEDNNRAMDAWHVIYPSPHLLAHDPWTVDLLEDPGSSGDWWNRVRVFRFGPLRFTVEMECSPEHRLTRPQLMEIASWLTDRIDLPNLFLCGSHSPLSPRLPHSLSDLDFVCFIPFEAFFSDVQYWCDIEAKTRLVIDDCESRFHRGISCGFLLEDFRKLPFMHDAVELTSGDDQFWRMTEEEKVDILGQRWDAFIEDANGQRSYQRVIDAIAELIGSHSIYQVATQSRWEDVGWSLTRPTWSALIRDWFNPPEEIEHGPES
jgi:hypothetical protein